MASHGIWAQVQFESWYRAGAGSHSSLYGIYIADIHSLPSVWLILQPKHRARRCVLLWERRRLDGIVSLRCLSSRLLGQVSLKIPYASWYDTFSICDLFYPACLWCHIVVRSAGEE